mmetsp:Transcript_13817/g.25799  ORF Transcript_13817/g.25799 Transcript_13817/m.25799 type:complete len:221 (+) Transcript_13817:367-1029(+)
MVEPGTSPLMEHRCARGLLTSGQEVVQHHRCSSEAQRLENLSRVSDTSQSNCWHTVVQGHISGQLEYGCSFWTAHCRHITTGGRHEAAAANAYRIYTSVAQPLGLSACCDWAGNHVDARVLSLYSLDEIQLKAILSAKGVKIEDVSASLNQRHRPAPIALTSCIDRSTAEEASARIPRCFGVLRGLLEISSRHHRDEAHVLIHNGQLSNLLLLHHRISLS